MTPPLESERTIDAAVSIFVNSLMINCFYPISFQIEHEISNVLYHCKIFWRYFFGARNAEPDLLRRYYQQLSRWVVVVIVSRCRKCKLTNWSWWSLDWFIRFIWTLIGHYFVMKRLTWRNRISRDKINSFLTIVHLDCITRESRLLNKPRFAPD